MITSSTDYLGIASYAKDFDTTDGGGLNLAWTLDERSLLRLDMQSLVESDEVLRTELFWRYDVTDPYGGATICQAAQSFFGGGIASDQIFCAAGVSSMLHALSMLVRKGLCALMPTYPDLPSWVMRRGLPAIAAPLSDAIDSCDLVLLENPGLFQSQSQIDIDEICEQTGDRDIIVVVDEANANYLSPQQSWVGKIDQHKNLVVVRGFSKAYGMGSLRVGVAFCSRAIKQRVQAVLPALAVTPVSLSIASAIWRAGDVGDVLRETIAMRREQMVSMLSGTSIELLGTENPCLPYLFMRATSPSIAALSAGSIRGKFHTSFSDLTSERRVYRLSLPLSEARMLRLIALLS
ncbi:aminotransferase class I/II-fold pyridoxal phosphate-dependent enzyme [Pandoraea sp. NPDC087047]|uniref:aminotransferase class I/II-fold pyridoxal phosphate-dependent enzyme n=1 Tax=Pandoraea sp. NPDC087047 TaxID=3364390 RepID=UPI00380B8BCD